MVIPHVLGVMNSDIHPRKGTRDGMRMRKARTREVLRSLPTWREVVDWGTSEIDTVIVLICAVGRG